MIVNTATGQRFEVGQKVIAESGNEKVIGEIVEIRDNCAFPIFVRDAITTYAFLWSEVKGF